MSDKDMRAFPSAVSNGGATSVKGFDGDTIKPGSTNHYPGMSLRDYFAAKAMQGALSAAAGDNFAENLRQRCLSEGVGIAEVLAMDAYITADAMLAERAK